MNETGNVPLWVFLISIGIVGSLVALVWNKTSNQQDRTTKTTDDHGERITRLEGDMETVKKETQTLRDRWHAQVEQVAHSLAQWYQELVDRINKR